MKRIKHFFFYSWWLNFWVAILAIVLFLDRPMLRVVGPIAFLAFVGFAFYATLVTRPSPEAEEKKETPQNSPPNNEK
jgi:hypothetical protein